MEKKFNISLESLKGLSKPFNELVDLENKVNGTTYRVDVFRAVKTLVMKSWKSLPETSSKSPLSVVIDVIGKESNSLLGELLASVELADGQSIAWRVKTSTSTGKNTYCLARPLPFFPGAESMIKSLAKKATKVGDSFAVKMRKGDKISTTVYSVVEKIEKGFSESGEPFDKTIKVATKATGWIWLYSPSEQSFKKGIVKGLKKIG